MRRSLPALLVILFLITACAGGGNRDVRFERDAVPGAQDRKQSTAAPKQLFGQNEPARPALDDEEAVAEGLEGEDIIRGGQGPFGKGGVAFKQDAGAQYPKVKVALLLPLTGRGSDIGQSMLKASQLALFDLGADNFELLPKDTNGTAFGARQAANEAVKEGAHLILGPLFSDSAQAIKPSLQNARINAISFSTDWAKAGDNVYMMGFMPFMQVQQIAAFAGQRGLNNIALIRKNDAYGSAVERTLMRFAGQQNINISNIIRAGGLLSPEDIANLSAQRPDAVFIALAGQEAIAISRQLTGAGMPPYSTKRLGTGLWDDPQLAKSPHLDGAWFAAPYPERRSEFVRSYSALYGEAPPRLATLAYDATALAAVLGKNGRYERSGLYVPAYGARDLENTNGFAGVDGVFRLGRDGLVQRNLSILEFRNKQINEIQNARQRF